MIEITYYEKKTIKFRKRQLLYLDEKIRKHLGFSDDDYMLIHDLLIHGGKFGLNVRLPTYENIMPDDDCVVPSASHLGYTRQELIEWLANEQIEDVPDIFDDI